MAPANRETVFVRSLFEIEAVLELNCAGLKHVCLQDFDALRRRCVLWDEGSPQLVADNRKVFQHPACWIDLGHSPTAQHVMRVWLNDACSIIATNKWEDALAQMIHGGAQWVLENSTGVNVDRPLWLPVCAHTPNP